MAINRRELIAASLALGAGAGTGTASAQAGWPSKPIRLVVPYPPGGSSDIIARAISQPLSEALKQSVIVDNKAGANGNLGADIVAKSAPDGYTLLLCDTGALAISPSAYPKLSFDPSKDLRGVTMLAYSPHLLVLMNGMLATLPHVQSGKLKILGVSKSTRMPLIGNVPTLAEQGIAGFESGTWQGLLVANGTPAAIINRLNTELIKIIRSPDIRAKLAGQGAEVVTMTPAQQDAYFNQERSRWAKVVTEGNIKLD
jgi:tripartite-type tricarboxylate transporter receptor subunit TctC